MNLTTLLYIAGALFAGVLIPIQTGYNTQLAKAMHGPMVSVLAVYVVGLIFMLAVAVATQTPIPSMAQALDAPRLAWFAGGILSALYVVLLVVLAPKLGAATTVAFVVVGQIVCSAVIDHFGLLGFPEHAASPQRLLGIALMAAGVALVRLF
jgi:transporter family-2 protein